jgi:arabinose-5-phosphate isomerase
MAVGDALAVALLRRRGLTAQDFAVVHPGGVLGRQVTRRVRDLMHAGDGFPVLPEGATLREALLEIVDKGLGITVLVTGDGRLSGVLTDGDLKRILLGPEGDTALSRPVARFMSPRPRTIEPEALIATAVRRMEERRPGAVTSLVVVQGERPVGILHLHDCLRVEPPTLTP